MAPLRGHLEPNASIDNEVVGAVVGIVSCFAIVLSVLVCGSGKSKEDGPAVGGDKPTKQTNQRPTKEELLLRVQKMKGVDLRLASALIDLVVDDIDSRGFGDIAGLEGAITALQEAVVNPIINPALFTGLRATPRGILMFGPPGNGKTMLVGEGGEIVKTMFSLARTFSPSIVFIDDCDSLLARRSEGQHAATRLLKSEFLSQFDGLLSSKKDQFTVLCATNRPSDLDEAVLRRFGKLVYVPLPDAESRIKLLEKLMKKHHNKLTRKQLAMIASKTGGYSYSDLERLAKEAAMGTVRDHSKKSLMSIFQSSKVTYFGAHSPFADVLAFQRGVSFPWDLMLLPPVPCAKVADELRPISMRDFKAALRTVTSTVDKRNLELLESFNLSHGS